MRTMLGRKGAFAALAVLLLVLAAWMGLPGAADALLFTAPCLALLGLLSWGRYLGEDRLRALAERFEAQPSRRVLRLRLPSAICIPVRGGLLLARSLAERGPPGVAPHLVCS